MGDAIREALTFDPLAHAEKITGRSYKDDDATARLGFGLALQHNQAKRELLADAGDSYYAMSFADQLAMFDRMGFRQVLVDQFAGRDNITESFALLWHDDGLLATCESYRGEQRNAAKVYYNYRHWNGYPGWELTSSGGMRGDVWVGDHDAREGIRHNLDAMRAEGEFVSPWVVRPFLWLLTYADTDVDGYDYAAINADRISRLPADVRAAIGGAADDCPR